MSYLQSNFWCLIIIPLAISSIQLQLPVSYHHPQCHIFNPTSGVLSSSPLPYLQSNFNFQCHIIIPNVISSIQLLVSYHHPTCHIFNPTSGVLSSSPLPYLQSNFKCLIFIPLAISSIQLQ